MEVQTERKPSNRQARTFSSRSTSSVGSNNPSNVASNPSNIPSPAAPPKFPGGRRRVEKTTSTTKEPTIADIEEENYPQHFKEHVKSKLPYQPKSKNRPAAYKSVTTTTSERPQIVEVTTPRKSLFKPRVKIEKAKPVSTTTSSTTTTARTTRSATKSRVFFPQRNPDIEKSTADNEIYDNVPTEREFVTPKNKFSAKFSTDSPVLHKNEDALRNVSRFLDFFIYFYYFEYN